MKVEVNLGIYFGVVVMDNDRERNSISPGQRQQILEALEAAYCDRFIHRKAEPHIVWAYGHGMEKLKFHGPNRALAHALADPTIFDGHVSSLVDDIVHTARALSDSWPKKQ
jgi:hypothetical protein